jgi:nucleoside-triphosphatase THEP1
MESFSVAFRAAVEDLLSGTVAVLGTVAVHGVGFVKYVRNDPRVTLVRMTRASREAIVGDLLRRLAAAGITRAEERA